MNSVDRALPLTHPARFTISWTIEVTSAVWDLPPAAAVSSISVPVAEVRDLPEMSPLELLNTLELSTASP